MQWEAQHISTNGLIKTLHDWVCQRAGLKVGGRTVLSLHTLTHTQTTDSYPGQHLQKGLAWALTSYLVFSFHIAWIKSFLWLVMTWPCKTSATDFSGYVTVLWGRNACACVMGEQSTEFSKWNKLDFFLAPKFKLRSMSKFPFAG